MSDAFITATSSEGLQSLGSAAQRSWELVTGTLRDRLGPDVAMIFAEPVATRHGAMTEWYAPGQGKPVALASLTPDEAAQVRSTLAAAVAQITALAETLAAQSTEEGFWQAEALRNALQVPDDAAVWALRGPDGGVTPLLVNWGRVPDDSRAVRGVLTATTPRARSAAGAAGAAAGAASSAAPAASLPPPGAAPARMAHGGSVAGLAGWLLVPGWLLLAAMIAFALWLLIAPCGLRPGFAGPCRAADPTAAAGATAHALNAEVAVLEATLAQRDLACLADRRRAAMTAPADAPAAPPADAPLQGAIDDLDRRLEARGAGQGAALTISLVWSGRDDMDIGLQCPSGQEVDWRRRDNDCGGLLDVDANYPETTAVDDPVENVTFPRIVPGRYTIKVSRPWDRAPNGPQSFAVVVRRAGGDTQRFEGTISDTARRWVQQIEIAP